MKRKFLINSQSVRSQVIECANTAPIGTEVLFRPKTRDILFNDKMWPMLRDIARQTDWCGEKLVEEEWKDLFTAALKRSRIVPGLDGGFVVIGGHTSRMSNEEMSDMIEMMYEFGTNRGVTWSEDHG